MYGSNAWNILPEKVVYGYYLPVNKTNMNTVKTVVKNTSSLFGAQLITSLLTPLLFIYIARTLGDEIFGKYSFILSLTAIFLIIADFGIKGVAIRDVSRDEKKVESYLGNIIILKLFFSTFCTLVLVLSVYFLDLPRDTTLASYIFAGGLFFQSMSYAFRWVLHALQVMGKEAIIRVLDRFLIFVFSVLVLWHGFGLIALSIVFLMTQFIIFLTSIVFVTKTAGLPPIRSNLSFSKYLIKTAVFFALCEVLWMIYFKIDIVMLAIIRGETHVGWYNAAYVIVNYITLISMLSMQVMFPVLSNLFKKETNRLKEATERLFRYLLVIALPIVPAIFILSDKIIIFLYGTEYEHSISALKILIFVILFLFPGNLFAHILASSNRHKQLTIINLIAVLVNILLNFIFIPKFGYIGAGISTIVTEIILCLLLFRVVFVFLSPSIGKIIKGLLPGTGAMVLIILLGRPFPLIPVTVFSLIVYFIFAFLTGSIKIQDFSMLSEIFKKEAPMTIGEAK